ncbi:helix-turn-helix transcriptional regulator [Streptomyces sp. NEAU-Y11]|uniref:helix-turn-helix transcriptional regulator n=1 Tax=Streptomyces cucumeris TaxID=2962890 RepID=UPI0020C85542|nr:AAA family ATPase [Streptomyces sp. NEAU-Y11]MCP9207548.1 AAA family ATPase [Streptomyces sp. NEAU-Y11]
MQCFASHSGVRAVVFSFARASQFDAQFEGLRRAFSRCLSREAGIVLVEGAVGCGKTYALEAVTAQAAKAGALVLKAYGSSADPAPLDTLRQLLDSPRLPKATADRLRRALDHGALGAAGLLETAGSATPGVPLTQVQGAREFRAALYELAAREPVVICVDELQCVDGLSLQYLLYLATRSHAAKLLMVFAQATDSEQKDAVFNTELLRQPNFQRVRLERLSWEETARLLTTRLGLPDSTDVSYNWYEVSGGNPLLLRALMDDYRTGGVPPLPHHAVDPVVGDMFVQAVLTCVYRSGHTVSRLAEGIAVLGASASPDLLARLLGLGPVGIQRGVAALAGAGLIDGLAFRDPCVEAAVLEDMEPGARLDMNRRAAVLLHQGGGATLAVARHLLAAQSADEPWAVPLLRDAAQQALAEDDAPLAVACLELAYAACDDEELRASIRIGTAGIMWRLNPSASERLLEEPLAALRAERLPASHIGRLIELLLAHGRIEEARCAIGRLNAVMKSAAPTPLSQFRMTARWAQDSGATDTNAQDPGTPERAPGAATRQGPDGGAFRAPSPSSHRPSSLSTITAAFTGFFGGGEREESPVAAAEKVLEVSPLTDATFESIVNSVNALVYAGRPDKAAPWCDSLMEEAASRRSPGWRAIFASIRAEIALRQGNLVESAAYATTALEIVPGRDGSVFIGGPLASQILAYTAMGKYDTAARQLSRPVPEALFRSIYGLGYTRARGRYYLATNRFNAALGEFLMAGKLAQHWELDQPAMLPWRSDAAEAWLALGEREKAATLVSEQLSRIGVGDSRVRGVSLRLLAAAGDHEHRSRLLGQAVEELQCSGDRLELARALDDLGCALRTSGDHGRADAITGRAWQMAKECGAAELCARIRLDSGLDPGDPRQVVQTVRGPLGAKTTVHPSLGSKLSESETRVAALAVDGYTNREIAANLYITISTVEQHLTRVYRKLNIRSRQQLPSALRAEVDEIA